MRRYDLLALDMDGTLLHSDLSLSERNIEAIRSYHEEGGKVFLISGRPDVMTLPYVLEMGDVDLYAAFNGALLGTNDGREIFSSGIEKKTLERACAVLKERSYSFSLLTKEGMYSNWGSFSFFGRQNEIASSLARKHGIPEGWLKPLEEFDREKTFYKIVIFKKEEEEENEKLLEELGKDSSLTITSSRSFMYDVSGSGIDKGSALQRGMDYFGIDRERVCVMGDYYNDVPMFQEAGLSIAMGNAPEEVRQKADKTVSSNNEDGVAEAIEKYLL